MTNEKRREICSKGGKAAQAKPNAHRWTPAEAAAAGRKGGVVIARDKEHMRAIGRTGGRRMQANRRASITTRDGVILDAEENVLRPATSPAGIE